MKLKYFILLILPALFYGCFRKTPLPAQPKVGVVQKGIFSAQIAASFAGIDIIDKGVCWSESENPNLNGNFKSAGKGSESFEMTITELSPLSKYFIRSYVTNEAGTVYSSNVTFTTLVAVSLSTSLAYSVTGISAAFTATMGTAANFTITERGVCWSTSPNPLATGNKATSNIAGSVYTLNIENLAPNTTYFARAYLKSTEGYMYGNETSFRTLGEQVTDINGNKYNTLTIGSQTWMLENLKVTKYNNGDNIPGVLQLNWSTANDAHGYLFDSGSNQVKYGNLYNFSAITDTRKIAPAGWRIPTQADWELLVNFLGSEAAWKLMSSNPYEWGFPDKTSANESRFNALSGGFRDNVGSDFSTGSQTLFWTSTASNNNQAMSFKLSISSIFASHELLLVNRKFGCYVRCIKNN